MSVVSAPVWISPLKAMPEVGTTVLCMLRHHSTHTIQESPLCHVHEDDLSWRTYPDNAELGYDWEVVCWQPKDERHDVHAVMAKLHDYEKAVIAGESKTEIAYTDLKATIEAMRSLIFAPAAGIDSSDRERLLWCARTIRAIADLDDDQPLGYTWWSQAVMVVGALKRVLNMNDEEFAAEHIKPLNVTLPTDALSLFEAFMEKEWEKGLPSTPEMCRDDVFANINRIRNDYEEIGVLVPNLEARFRHVLQSTLGDAYYCVKSWENWGKGKMRASDFVSITSPYSGRVDIIVHGLKATLTKETT